MNAFFKYTFSNSQNVVLSIVTSIAALAAIILPFTNQIGTDNGGWQMILGGGLFLSVIYFAMFGFKSAAPYLATGVIGILSFMFFWMAFIPLFLASLSIIFWKYAYSEYQDSLLPPVIPPTS